MAFNTELITTAQVVTECIPDASFDVARLTKYILPAQRQYLEDAIGETFYETLLAEKAAGSFSAENQLLYDNFIIQMLSWFVLFDALPYIRNNITPQGIMINATEFAQQSTVDDYARLRNATEARAERWKNDLRKYIIDIRESDTSAFADYNPCKDTHQNKTGFILYGTNPHGHNHGHHHGHNDHHHDCNEFR